jgi:hypothetical protein
MARKRKKRRGPGIILILAIVLLIAGFVVRRILMPPAIHYLAYRPAEKPALAPAAIPSEDLSASDRNALDQTIQDKSR